MRFELISAVSETTALSFELRGQVNARPPIDRTFVASRIGLEPIFLESGSSVLPLDDRAMILTYTDMKARYIARSS